MPDGAADYPLEELDGKTPWQVATTPQTDFLASKGILGRVKTVPAGMEPGSDVANLSLLGYDPHKYYSGRGPLEAVSMGIKLGDGETAFRCNLVTVESGTLKDYSAGHISTQEAAGLIRAVQNMLGDNNFTFYPGVSYRHLMVTKNDFSSTICMPPHNVVGKHLDEVFPSGSGAETLKKLMSASTKILEMHSVNHMRKSRKKNPANMIWLWGQGEAPSLPAFREKYGLEGAIISAVDLVKGIGWYAGLEAINVPGATGYFDTDYLAKAEYALRALKKKDFVFVHVEAPDEAGHMGNIEEKIRAIENFDKKIVGPVYAKLKGTTDFKILIAPDHATPIKVKTHTSDPVPFLVYSSLEETSEGSRLFCEATAVEASLYFDAGFKLMDFFILSN